jgi:hypothetical protein
MAKQHFDLLNTYPGPGLKKQVRDYKDTPSAFAVLRKAFNLPAPRNV